MPVNDKVKDLMDFVFPQQIQPPMAPEQPIPQMEGLVPQPVINAPIEDYGAMVEADQIEKSLAPVIDPRKEQLQKVMSKLSAGNSSKSSAPVESPVTPDFRDQLLEQMAAARNENKSALQDARGVDSKVALLNNMNKAFSQIGTGIGNQAGYTKLTSNPLEVSSDKAGQTTADNKSNLEALSEAYKVKSDKEISQQNKEKMKADREDKSFDRSYKQQLLALEKAKIDKEKAVQDGAGQKELDKQAAKEYQEWSSGGAKIAQSEINKLKETLNKLESGGVTTGGLTGLFPDQLTSNKVLSARSNIQSSVMGSLRALLGAQFTEKEGERVIKNTWNEADSTENNIARVKRLVGDLENKAADKNQKAQYFQENKSSLKGFESKPSENTKSASSEDDKAIAWAKSNPSDPRAKKILSLHGVE